VFSVGFPASLLGGFLCTIRGLKTGGNLPGPGAPKFPPIVSRGVFLTPSPIWRPLQPPVAQRNRPFFLAVPLRLRAAPRAGVDLP
jgi:hypothetical protein